MHLIAVSQLLSQALARQPVQQAPRMLRAAHAAVIAGRHRVAVTRTRGTTVGLLAGGGAAAALVPSPLLRLSSSSASSGSGSPAEQQAHEWRRFAVEMGTGTSLRREDHTAAAVRALQDALWRISLTAYRALDMDPNSMRVEIVIGVPKPEEVDHAKVLAVLPYGERSIKVVKGGLAIDGGCGADAHGQIIMANAAAIVSLDVGDYIAFKREASKAAAEAEAILAEEQDEQLWTSPSGNTMSAAEAEAILAKHFK
jgi:uncharacterized protein (TIGR02058 family)